MRKAMTMLLIAGYLAALILAAGCEDTPLVAGANYKMILTANPPNVNLDPTDQAATTISTIRATVLSDTGAPQPGFIVYFSTDGGTLDPAKANGVKTNSAGEAADDLTIDFQSPATMNVTANSSTLSETVKVTKNDPCAVNSPPVAVITGTDPQPAPTGTPVQFIGDGSTSTDSDGAVVSYQWDCGTNPVQGGTSSTVTCNYTVDSVTKSYTVTLTVTDNGLGTGPPYQCQKTSDPKTRQVVVAKTAAARGQ